MNAGGGGEREEKLQLTAALEETVLSSENNKMIGVRGHGQIRLAEKNRM